MTRASTPAALRPQALLSNDRGQSLVEYALIIFLIAVACVLSLNYLGQRASNTMGNNANSIANVLG